MQGRPSSFHRHNQSPRHIGANGKTPGIRRKFFPQQLVGVWSPWWIVHYYIPLALFIAAKIILDQVGKLWEGYTVTAGDPTYNKPVIPDLIPSWANSLLSILGPALIMVGVHVIWVFLYRKNTTTLSFFLLDIHNAWIGLVASWMLSSLVTGTLKYTLGLPRSTFGDNAARKSFPSGHATASAMGFIFLFWFVAGKWQVYSNSKSKKPTSWWKLIVLFILLAVPITVAGSRIRDFSHFPVDVVTGFLIGAVTSTLIYRTVFRWPWEPNSWEPLRY